MSEVNTTNMSKLQVKKISQLTDILSYNGISNSIDIDKLEVPDSISILLANETDQGNLLKDNYKIKLYDIFTKIKNWVSIQINNLNEKISKKIELIESSIKDTNDTLNDKIDKTKDEIESNLTVTNINTKIPDNYIEIEKTTNGKNIDYNIKLDVIENIDNENNGLITKDQVIDLLNKDKWNKI